MATVSHLPHVIANVLVQQAAAAAAEESERLPEVGPSFRDTTRVAGANPPIWGDIFATNREAVAREVEAVSERLREAAELIRSGDAERVGAWHGAAREDRRRLLEAELVGGELYELRLSVENRPGTVAEIALALGRAGVNIEDMALYPAPDMRTGAVSLWVAGRGRGRARGRDRARAGPQRVRSRGDARFDPFRAAARHAAAPARQVDQPPRGADRGDGGGGDGDRGLPGRRRTRGRPSPRSRGSAREVEELGPSSAAGGSDLRVAGDRAARPGGAIRRGAGPVAIDVGNAGTLLRILPGWLAGQGSGRLDPRRRRVDPAPSGGPGRRAAADDGRRRRVPRRAPAAARGRGRRRFTASRTSCRWRAPR